MTRSIIKIIAIISCIGSHAMVDCNTEDYTTQTEYIGAPHTTSSDMTVFRNDLETHLIKLISHINHANRIVNDMCEMMEEKVSMWSGSDKPNCRFNASFIVNKTVHLFDVGENVRNFFLNRKQSTCKESHIDCGELTIMLKIVDLVNSIVHISLNVTSTDDLFTNVEAVSFYELFQTYTETLTNHELLTNITLRRERANSILERERARIHRTNSMTSTESFLEYTNIYIGAPIKSGFIFIGDTVGSGIGTLFGSALSGTGEAFSLSSENKLIILGFFAILLLRR